MSTNIARRIFLKSAGLASILIPLVTNFRQARANTNSNVHCELKYQDFPKDSMNCSSCLEFIPVKTDKDLGRCKLIPGDDEISFFICEFRL